MLQEPSSMNYETNRLKTFEGWPTDSPAKPAELAGAGLYYTGIEDSVQCFSCRQKLSGWQEGDDSYVEHLKHFGDKCNFIKDPENSGNIAITALVSTEEGSSVDEADSLDLTDGSAVGSTPFPTGEKRKLFNGDVGDMGPKSPRVDGDEDCHHTPDGDEDTQTDSICRAPPTRTGEPQASRENTQTDAMGKLPQGIFTKASFDPPPERREVPTGPLCREVRDDPLDILIAKTKQLSLGETDIRNEIQSRTLSESVVRSLMKREQVRLATFETWPMREVIDPRQVAAVGFYYTGKDDCVKCAFCEGTLESWGADDLPFGEHKHFFGDVCPLVQGRHTSNIPMFCLSTPVLESAQSRIYSTQATNDRSMLKGLQVKKARYPQYINSLQRGLTFESWPKNFPPRADLVDAGFWFTGIGDHVKCYFCGGGLKEWDDIDQPWREHAKHFKECAYVTKVKGSAFIQAVQQDYEQEKKHKKKKPQPGEIVDLRVYNRDEEGLMVPMQVDPNPNRGIRFGRTETDIYGDVVDGLDVVSADTSNSGVSTAQAEADSVIGQIASDGIDNNMNNASHSLMRRLETDSLTSQDNKTTDGDAHIRNAQTDHIVPDNTKSPPDGAPSNPEEEVD